MQLKDETNIQLSLMGHVHTIGAVTLTGEWYLVADAIIW
jgi:hypothetical protein